MPFNYRLIICEEGYLSTVHAVVSSHHHLFDHLSAIMLYCTKSGVQEDYLWQLDFFRRFQTCHKSLRKE